MYKESDGQHTFFGNFIYDRIVPKDHFLRQLQENVDFSFVNELCKDLYCPDNGRPCWEPQLLFKVLLLQYLYNLSDAKIEEESRDRLSFKYFMGIDADADPPDATTLVRFRERLGEQRFAEIFNRIVTLARERGLVSDRMHIIDATVMKAKVDVTRIRDDHHRTGGGESGVSKSEIKEKAQDKDAEFGYDSSTKCSTYGYKGYVEMDKDSEIIVSSDIDTANEQEGPHLRTFLEHALVLPGTMLGDKAYDSPRNQDMLKSKNITSGILRKRTGNLPVLHRGCFARQDPQSREEITALSRQRQVIEHKIAEIKRWHNLRAARFLGIVKAKIQMFLTCIAVNLKRIVKILLGRGLSPPQWTKVPG